jgi:hypothetical protein
MKKTTISYSELAKRVGDCILFNNHNANNEQWYETIYLQPLLQEKLDELDEENEVGEDDDHASVLDIEIYQSYHITRSGAEYLLNHTSEVVSYDETLDAYIWHISHFGSVYTTFTDYSDDNDYDYLYIDEVNYAF